MQICVTVYADPEPAEDNPAPPPCLLSFNIGTPPPSPDQPLEEYVAQVITETVEYALGEAVDAEAAAEAALADTEEVDEQ